MTQVTCHEVADVAHWFAQALDYPRESSPVPAPPVALERWLPDAQALVARRAGVTYCALFDIGTPEPPVPLLESHYHRDPLARLRRVVNFYRAYGVVQGEHVAPDHLCVELAYLAYLARVATMYPLREDLVAAMRAFAHAHPASFVERLAEAVHRHDDTGVYDALFSALARFLADVGGETRIALGEEAA